MPSTARVKLDLSVADMKRVENALEAARQSFARQANDRTPDFKAKRVGRDEAEAHERLLAELRG